MSEVDAMYHDDIDHYTSERVVLRLVKNNPLRWLDESRHISGLMEISPPRCSSSNPQGMWEYSPFLHAVSLAENLELSNIPIVMLWDSILVHIA
ncbi:uncharacterized protein F4807DRAFT_226074 [Annulohypoxylon truncatum]|uniref:uncharacterized protein n=1 Tax=Annulohypoxylon truncatum TaxID=327061 RepID=UPI0020088B9A|nr:uncharacterized protein F4807DRAFT_226074 [Annulohypoxylon truncatum]KAI1206588.1 hypothetical protein F4807DRAFT_226074 [Annulohypoxylon truncatum]